MGVASAFGVATAFLAVVVLGAHEHAQLAFDHAVVLVRVVDHAFADLDVLVELLVAGVDHHAGESLIDALLAELKRVAVVQMDGDGDVGQAHGGFDQLLQVNRVGVLAGAFGDLQHHLSFFLFAGFHDGLEQLHVVYVESPEGVLPLQGFGKQVSGMCQWHSIDMVLLGRAARSRGHAQGPILESKRQRGSKIPLRRGDLQKRVVSHPHPVASSRSCRPALPSLLRRPARKRASPSSASVRSARNTPASTPISPRPARLISSASTTSCPKPPGAWRTNAACALSIPSPPPSKPPRRSAWSRPPLPTSNWPASFSRRAAMCCWKSP